MTKFRWSRISNIDSLATSAEYFFSRKLDEIWNFLLSQENPLDAKSSSVTPYEPARGLTRQSSYIFAVVYIPVQMELSEWLNLVVY